MVENINLKDANLIGKIMLAPPTYLDNEDHSNQIDVVKCEKNYYYGREYDYVKEGEYYRPKGELHGYIRVHESCFKYPISVVTIATVTKENDLIQIKFIDNRPLDLNLKTWGELRNLLWEAYNELYDAK